MCETVIKLDKTVAKNISLHFYENLPAPCYIFYELFRTRGEFPRFLSRSQGPLLPQPVRGICELHVACDYKFSRVNEREPEPSNERSRALSEINNAGRPLCRQLSNFPMESKCWVQALHPLRFRGMFSISVRAPPYVHS